MPIKPITDVFTRGANGVGAFVLQCKRMDFHYCDWAGSSKGMNTFIEKALPKFAASHPEIEITVSPKPQRHPTVIAHYINGRTRPVCLKKCDMNQIIKKVEMLRDSTGEINRKVNKPVRSYNESVRGIWSPYHGDAKAV
ncbi:39S ribosomal protein L51, mitochondrial [Gnomoniopsis smithogilvyi]|uniref:Large ribosomal subunit protein mL43 n=1 Tax=Gnomoniopsis smithogilvyi TaxID=1191159 RepID=A0A9W8YUY1_9PEZI|nr:39S ribosomal protein L51, mitochondrial [Gnomoniopsis smithogilvyi]